MRTPISSLVKPPRQCSSRRVSSFYSVGWDNLRRVAGACFLGDLDLFSILSEQPDTLAASVLRPSFTSKREEFGSVAVSSASTVFEERGVWWELVVTFFASTVVPFLACFAMLPVRVHFT